MKAARLIFVLIVIVAAVVTLVRREQPLLAPRATRTPQAELMLIPHPKSTAEKIVNGAKNEAIRGVVYDSSYKCIGYPNGDVASDRGACTDVIIRALRNAGYDLQRLIQEDMSRNFSLYPKNWGLTRPDSNIDHRRVPNHIVFMRRFATELPMAVTDATKHTWKPGDLIYWDLTGGGLTHCGVISNERNSDGLPLVIHNIGPCVSQENCLTNWKIIGHYRYPKARPTATGPRCAGTGSLAVQECAAARIPLTPARIRA